MIDLFVEVWATLKRSPMRTLLTAGGVGWGMFMLLVMLGFGEALEDMALRKMGGQATNSVWIWGGRTSIPYQGSRPGMWVSYNNSDIDALTEELHGLKVIAPRCQLGGWRSANSVVAAGNAGEYHVMGDHPAIFDVILLDRVAGRLLNPLDIERQRKVAVIGEQVKLELFGRDQAVGKSIAVRGVHFTVVGVVRSTKPDERGDRDNNTIIVPFNTFQRAFNFGDEVGWFAMIGEEGVLAADLEEQARGVLASRHGIHPDDRNAVGSRNTHEEYLRFKNLFAGIRAFVWVVGAATLLTGVVGVSNIMLIIVRERTSEIGLRRALGATRRSIIGMVVLESIVLTVLAGYIGLLAGLGLIEVAAWFIGPDNENMGQPEVGLTPAVIAAVVLVVSGLFAGLLPAHRASQVDPVVALRSE
ncbi:MAG: putative ABC transport system permease protein [Kiritimatiellia bacterium]|jgi:putative ABC transport system permease protein